MRLVEPPQRSAGNKLDDGMIPAINVVFLLLIFFMIAGRIEAKTDQLQIPESVSEAALAEKTITIRVMANGDYYLNDKPVNDALSAEFGLLELSPDSSVNCHIHRDLPATALDPVLEIVRLSGITKLQIATEQLP